MGATSTIALTSTGRAYALTSKFSVTKKYLMMGAMVYEKNVHDTWDEPKCNSINEINKLILRISFYILTFSISTVEMKELYCRAYSSYI
jgi:hypothetical protein